MDVSLYLGIGIHIIYIFRNDVYFIIRNGILRVVNVLQTFHECIHTTDQKIIKTVLCVSLFHIPTKFTICLYYVMWKKNENYNTFEKKTIYYIIV